MNNSWLFLYDIFLTADIAMSRLWSTLKSVVGGTALKEVEPLAAAAVSVSPPGATLDGIFRNLSSVKPHVPLIKFRYSMFTIVSACIGFNYFLAQERTVSSV